ncbi:MAG: hypothetical protein PHE25_02530 [Candidatus Gracilibacteria bacterium]|nr:hypothetical protein [Candidatus Gracilibacteria bacterium]
MGNLDGLQQVENLCRGYDSNPNTNLDKQVGEAGYGFNEKLRKVTSYMNYLPGREHVNASGLQLTLDTKLGLLIPQINEDASSGCLAAADAIKYATTHLQSQSLANSYVKENSPNSPSQKFGGYFRNLTAYATGDKSLAQK